MPGFLQKYIKKTSFNNQILTACNQKIIRNQTVKHRDLEEKPRRYFAYLPIRRSKTMSQDHSRPERNDPAAPAQPIVDMGSTVVKNSRGTVHTLTVVGQIEGHILLPDNTKTTKYEHILPLLAALEQSEQIDGLLLLLNTVGGDIEAGLAIAELVSGMKKPVVTLVLGGGHSIGVPLAVSGKTTFIAPSASMTLHPVRMSGTVIAAPETYRYFQRIQEQIIEFVAKNSKITAEKFRALMLDSGDMANDIGTVLYGLQAVEAGLIDRVGSLSDALNALYEMIGKESK